MKVFPLCILIVATLLPSCSPNSSHSPQEQFIFLGQGHPFHRLAVTNYGNVYQQDEQGMKWKHIGRISQRTDFVRASMEAAICADGSVFEYEADHRYIRVHKAPTLHIGGIKEQANSPN